MLLVAASAAASVWLVFFSSLLSVSSVRITGHDLLAPELVRRAAAVPQGEPLATVDLAAIAARVETLAPVRSVDVSRTWPDGVRIVVGEREAVAVVDRGGVVQGMDAEGVIFRDYPSAPEDLPMIETSVGTQPEVLAEAATVAAVLPAELAAKVEVMEIGTIDTISLRLRGGRTVVWGSAEDSTNKAKVIALLLRQNASTYDVSVPGQPTIRR